MLTTAERRGANKFLKMRNMKKRRLYRRRKLYIKKTIPSRSHIFKRYGNEVVISTDSSGIPVITQTNSSWTLGNTNSSGYLSGAVNFGISGEFAIKDVRDASDFTQLFDRYKIVGVKLKFLYQQNSVPVGGLTSFPVINYAFDADDSNTPTGIDQLQAKGYNHEKVLNANSNFSYYIKPRVSKMLYSQSLSGVGGYSSEKACWIDCQSSSVPHYGFKAWIKDWYTLSSNQVLTIQPVFYLAMKDSQ